MTLLFKIHYALFYGSLVGVLPFLFNYARRYSGASGLQQGILYSITPFVAVIAQPIGGYLADLYSAHFGILIASLVFTILGYGSLLVYPFFPSLLVNHQEYVWFGYCFASIVGNTSMCVAAAISDALSYASAERQPGSNEFGLFKFWGTVGSGFFGTLWALVNELPGLPAYTPGILSFVTLMFCDILLISLWKDRREFEVPSDESYNDDNGLPANSRDDTAPLISGQLSAPAQIYVNEIPPTQARQRGVQIPSTSSESSRGANEASSLRRNTAANSLIEGSDWLAPSEEHLLEPPEVASGQNPPAPFPPTPRMIARRPNSLFEPYQPDPARPSTSGRLSELDKLPARIPLAGPSTLPKLESAEVVEAIESQGSLAFVQRLWPLTLGDTQEVEQKPSATTTSRLPEARRLGKFQRSRLRSKLSQIQYQRARRRTLGHYPQQTYAPYDIVAHFPQLILVNVEPQFLGPKLPATSEGRGIFGTRMRQVPEAAPAPPPFLGPLPSRFRLLWQLALQNYSIFLYLMLMVFAGMMASVHAQYFYFFLDQLTEKSDYNFWTIVALIIPAQSFLGEAVFYLSAKTIIRFLGPTLSIVFGILSYALRYLLYAYLLPNVSIYWLVAIECLQGPAYCLTYYCLVYQAFQFSTKFNKIIEDRVGSHSNQRLINSYQATLQCIFGASMDGVGLGLGALIGGGAFDSSPFVVWTTAGYMALGLSLICLLIKLRDSLVVNCSCSIRLN